MARLASDAKAGFYPISPVAMEGILKHVYLADKSKEHTIIDPCAGEGHAIKQLSEGVGIPQSHVYAVELDLGRYKAAKALMPEAQFLTGPASFLGTQISGYSFSLAYVNPPYSSELGGGRREEQVFVSRATHLLGAKGVLVLVMPIAQLIGNRSLVQFVDSYYSDVQIYRLSDGHRNFNEVVLFGRKRKIELPLDAMEKLGTLHQRSWQWSNHMRAEDLPPLGAVQPKSWRGNQPSWDLADEVQTWPIERGWRPGTFKKVSHTEEELIEVVSNSPLGAHLTEVTPREIPRPPLPLDRGHLGLILASGILDGVVESPHGPHVVRGSSTKVEYYNKEASDSTEDLETGAVTTKDVYSQRMVTIIRCVTSDGTIHTFSNAPKEEGDENE
jgi:predicted RNA methylase